MSRWATDMEPIQPWLLCRRENCKETHGRLFVIGVLDAGWGAAVKVVSSSCQAGTIGEESTLIRNWNEIHTDIVELVGWVPVGGVERGRRGSRPAAAVCNPTPRRRAHRQSECGGQVRLSQGTDTQWRGRLPTSWAGAGAGGRAHRLPRKPTGM